MSSDVSKVDFRASEIALWQQLQAQKVAKAGATAGSDPVQLFMETIKEAPKDAPQPNPQKGIEEATDAFNIFIADVYKENADSEDAKALQAFWNTVSKNPDSAAAEVVLGKFLFLIDEKDRLKKAIELAKRDDAQNAVTKEFIAIIDELKIKFNTEGDDIANDAKKYGINPTAPVVKRNLLPTLLAKILVTTTGFVNISALKDSLVDTFCTGQEEVKRMLNLLAEKGELYSCLNAVQPPKSEDIASWPLIRSMLTTKGNAEVDEVAAKRAALSAYLAPVTKTSIDDEVTTRFGMELKLANPVRFAKDINTLIEHGCLERDVAGQPEPVRFTISPHSEYLVRTIKPSKTGQLNHNRYFGENIWLYEFHGMKTAAKAMGIRIDGTKTATVGALETLGANTKANSFDVTLVQVVDEMAKQTKVENAAQLALYGNFALLNLFENPVLRSWQEIMKKIASQESSIAPLAKVHHTVHALFAKHAAGSAEVGALVASRLSGVLPQAPREEKALKAHVAKAFSADERKLPQVAAAVKELDEAALAWIAGSHVDAESFINLYKGVVPQDWSGALKDAATALREKLLETREQENGLFSANWLGDGLFEADVAGFAMDGIKETLATMGNFIVPATEEKAEHEWTLGDIRAQVQLRLKGVGLEDQLLDTAMQRLDNHITSLLHQVKPELFASMEVAKDNSILLYPDPVTGNVGVGKLVEDKFVRINPPKYEAAAVQV